MPTKSRVGGRGKGHIALIVVGATLVSLGAFMFWAAGAYCSGCHGAALADFLSLVIGWPSVGAGAVFIFLGAR